MVLNKKQMGSGVAVGITCKNTTLAIGIQGRSRSGRDTQKQNKWVHRWESDRTEKGGIINTGEPITRISWTDFGTYASSPHPQYQVWEKHKKLSRRIKVARQLPAWLNVLTRESSKRWIGWLDENK